MPVIFTISDVTLTGNKRTRTKCSVLRIAILAKGMVGICCCKGEAVFSCFD